MPQVLQSNKRRPGTAGRHGRSENAARPQEQQPTVYWVSPQDGQTVWSTANGPVTTESPSVLPPMPEPVVAPLVTRVNNDNDGKPSRHCTPQLELDEMDFDFPGSNDGVAVAAAFSSDSVNADANIPTMPLLRSAQYTNLDGDNVEVKGAPSKCKDAPVPGECLQNGSAKRAVQENAHLVSNDAMEHADDNLVGATNGAVQSAESDPRKELLPSSNDSNGEASIEAHTGFNILSSSANDVSAKVALVADIRGDKTVSASSLPTPREEQATGEVRGGDACERAVQAERVRQEGQLAAAQEQHERHLADLIAQHDREKLALRQQYASLEQRINLDLKQSIQTAAAAAVQPYRDQCNQQAEKISELERESRHMQAVIAKSDADGKNFRAELHTLQTALTDCRLSLVDAKHCLCKATDDRDAKEEQLWKAQIDVAALKSSIDALSTTATARENKVQQQVSELRQTSTEQQGTIEQLHDRLLLQQAQAQIEMSRLEQMLQTKHDNNLAMVKQDAGALQAKYDALLGEKEDLERKFAARQVEPRSRIDTRKLEHVWRGGMEHKQAVAQKQGALLEMYDASLQANEELLKSVQAELEKRKAAEATNNASGSDPLAPCQVSALSPKHEAAHQTVLALRCTLLEKRLEETEGALQSKLVRRDRTIQRLRAELHNQMASGEKSNKTSQQQAWHNDGELQHDDEPRKRKSSDLESWRKKRRKVPIPTFTTAAATEGERRSRVECVETLDRSFPKALPVKSPLNSRQRLPKNAAASTIIGNTSHVGVRTRQLVFLDDSPVHPNHKQS